MDSKGNFSTLEGSWLEKPGAGRRIVCVAEEPAFQHELLRDVLGVYAVFASRDFYLQCFNFTVLIQ
jgi:hypothetical protein